MAGSPNLSRFYVVLLVVAVAGAGVLYWQARGKAVSIPADVVVTAADTAGFSGYYLGRAEAPVVITEYADYQCPACQAFEEVQFPNVVSQLIETGVVRWRYRDFPLNIHPSARVAAHSAACADDQGKYWEQHATLYRGQSDWSFGRDPAGTFRDYAKANGLDLAAYDACMSSAKYAGRIQASYEEGMRVGVGSTPTLLVGGRLYVGVQPSDELKRLADSLAAAAPTQ